MRTDGRAGWRMTLIVAFLDFAKAPKNSNFSVTHNTYYIQGYRVTLRVSLNEIYTLCSTESIAFFLV
jgi:hypothetical protein